MTAPGAAPLVPAPQAAEFERPTYRVYDHGTNLAGVKLRPGVWHHKYKTDAKGEERTPVDEWLCGPLHVDAVTRSDSQDSNYGRLLRFRNEDQKELTWAMPNELLAGKPDSILEVLLGMGLDIDYRRRTQICHYVASQRPARRVIAATSTGWHTSHLFIMPKQNIGLGDAIFQSESAYGDEYRMGGSLEGWQSSIGAWCADNPLLMLSVCVSLAGALLFHVQRSGGGFHAVGDSSTGKSTLVLAGCSVWGHGENFKRTWRATGNGLEGIAAQRNDTLLALDEIGEADPREIGAVIYAMANGTGKARASRTGAARASRRWRVMLLSSGELGLSAMIAEGGKRSRAGQEIRLIDIPARRRYGAWDNLHSFAGGREFSDAIQRASMSDFGHAGPAFVRRLLEHNELEALPERLTLFCSQYSCNNGQESRASERFALVALAGELAVEFGILPLEKGTIQGSMLTLFESWRAGRGDGPCEDRQILRSVADFIGRHGDTRFSSVKAIHAEARDRAGYWEEHPSGRLFLFSRTGLEEAAKGHDLSRVVMALDSVGAITKKDAGRDQATKRLGDGSKLKLYVVDPARLEHSE